MSKRLRLRRSSLRGCSRRLASPAPALNCHAAGRHAISVVEPLARTEAESTRLAHRRELCAPLIVHGVAVRIVHRSRRKCANVLVQVVRLGEEGLVPTAGHGLAPFHLRRLLGSLTLLVRPKTWSGSHARCRIHLRTVTRSGGIACCRSGPHLASQLGR